MPILGGCLCFDLPTGTKIIGGIYIFMSILCTLLLSIINIAVWGMGMIPKLMEMLDEIFDKGGDDSMEKEDPTAKEYREQMRALVDLARKYIDGFQILLLVWLVLAILSLITSSMLIHGVRRRCRGYLLPWVIQEIVHIVLSISLMVFVFVIAGAIQWSWMVALPVVLGVGLSIFFILVVISQYQALELIRMQDEICMK